MFKKAILSFLLCFFVLNPKATQASDVSCMDTWNQISQSTLEPIYEPLVGLCDTDFRNELSDKISTNKTLEYKEARHILFSSLDNFGGTVCDVYSSTCISTRDIPDPSRFNTEHSWCQSWGATGTAKSDLHHLYPVRSDLNSRRNNFPFCEVLNSSWEEDGSVFGKSYSGTTCFEPPNWHKGELARAMLYFAVRYSREIDPEQEAFFRKWNEEYPVSNKEYQRNEGIYGFQGNRNPFILHPSFVNLIQDF